MIGKIISFIFGFVAGTFFGWKVLVFLIEKFLVG